MFFLCDAKIPLAVHKGRFVFNYHQFSSISIKTDFNRPAVMADDDIVSPLGIGQAGKIVSVVEDAVFAVNA